MTVCDGTRGCYYPDGMGGRGKQHSCPVNLALLEGAPLHPPPRLILILMLSLGLLLVDLR